MKNLAYELLKNEATARDYLIKKYPESEAKTLAYRNVHAFTSYIIQGLALFENADQSNIWSKPFLLYYGMMSLLKAFALTQDPNYPQNTAILQHGLTSPKRKKEPYRFFRDEIRVQKDGFFPYLCDLLRFPVPTGERYKMEFLCTFIPELLPVLIQLKQPPSLWKLEVEDHTIICSTDLLDEVCLSASSFVNRLNAKHPKTSFSLGEVSDQHFTLYFTDNLTDHPYVYQDKQGYYYIWSASKLSTQQPVPEILSHFGLLYTLSMLCRYDPPIMRELFNDTETEQIIIQELLWIIRRKFPTCLLTYFDLPKT
jgi:hypothetical protein